MKGNKDLTSKRTWLGIRSQLNFLSTSSTFWWRSKNQKGSRKPKLSRTWSMKEFSQLKMQLIYSRRKHQIKLKDLMWTGSWEKCSCRIPMKIWLKNFKLNTSQVFMEEVLNKSTKWRLNHFSGLNPDWCTVWRIPSDTGKLTFSLSLLSYLKLKIPSVQNF